MTKIAQRILFYKALLVEIIETLCSICLFLEMDGRFRHNPQTEHMRGHFVALKQASSVLRRETAERGKNETI